MSAYTPPHRHWKILAPVGLILIGAGLSVAIDAALERNAGAALWSWVGMGTLGLILTNAGISLFGDAVKRRMWDEVLRRERQGEEKESSEQPL